MHCKDCRFWESHTGIGWDLFKKTWNACDFPTQMSYPYTKIEDNGIAVYADANADSGLNSGLITGPMFGCIKFEQKETLCT